MHPMHPNCRCFTIPDEPDDMLSQFTRSAQTEADNWEEVPASMTWEEWRKKYVGRKDSEEQQLLTSNAKQPDQVKIDGWDGEKPVAKAGESGILNQEGDVNTRSPNAEKQRQIEYEAVQLEIQQGPDNPNFGSVVRRNHWGLKNFTPAGMKESLEQFGFEVKPLGRGNYKGIPFENGGGYRAHYGGNGIIQYHPPGRSHHGGAYWKIQDTKEGARYDMDGNEI